MYKATHILDNDIILLGYWVAKVRRYVWVHHLQHVLITVACLPAAVVMLQFVYPYNRALPLAKVAGQSVGLRSENQIATQVAAASTANFHVIAGTRHFDIAPDSLGIAVDSEQVAKQATTYSWRERLIPFSFLRMHSQAITFKAIDTTKTQAFAQKIVQENMQAAHSATVVMKGTRAIVTPAQEGFTYDADQIVQTLKGDQDTFVPTVHLSPQPLLPAITTAKATAAAAAVDTRLSTPLAVTVNGTAFTVDKALLAQWVMLTTDTSKRAITIDYNQAAIAEFLKARAGYAYKAAHSSHVILEDGAEISRSGGAKGQALDLTTSTKAVLNGLQTMQAHVDTKTVATTPTTIYDRRYTRSSKGVQALISYWVQHNGGQYGVSLRSLSGSSITASYAGGTAIRSASLYKLYVIYVIYSKIAAGELSESTVTSTGKTIHGCIDAMVVVSDNPCGVALGTIIGWGDQNSTLHAKGFSATNLDSVVTSANDTTRWLADLYNGSLVSVGARSDLMGMMARQIYRSGIPAANPGVRVLNKVGFLGGYNNDAAIVYSPKGTYALTILSSGASFAKIAALAGQIAQVMDQ